MEFKEPIMTLLPNASTPYIGPSNQKEIVLDWECKESLDFLKTQIKYKPELKKMMKDEIVSIMYADFPLTPGKRGVSKQRVKSYISSVADDVIEILFDWRGYAR